MMRMWRKVAALKGYIRKRVLLVGNGPAPRNRPDPSRYDEIVLFNEVRDRTWLEVGDRLWMRRDRPDGSHFGGESVMNLTPARPVLLDGRGPHAEEIRRQLADRNPVVADVLGYCPGYPGHGLAPSTGYAACCKYVAEGCEVHCTGFS
jgi:hypothetical protein